MELLPPNNELEYPVGALDEDEGFLPAAVQGGAVDVDELVADSQLLTQGGLPVVLDLSGRSNKDGELVVMRQREEKRELTEEHSHQERKGIAGIFEKDREEVSGRPFGSCQVFKRHF